MPSTEAPSATFPSVAGVALPSAVPLAARDVLDRWRRAAELELSPLLTTEINGMDALVMAGAVSASDRRVSVGSGIAPWGARSEATFAMAAATLADLSDAPVVLGIGTSTPAVVGGWHDAAHDGTLAGTRERVERLDALLRGERHGPFRLAQGDVRDRVRILLGVMGPRMTDLAHTHADGVIVNHTPPDRIRSGPSGKDVIVYAWVRVSDDADLRARRQLVGYATTKAYGRHFRDLGFGDDVDMVREYQEDGRLSEAASAISEQFVDAIYAPLDELGARLAAFHATGAHPVVIPVLGDDAGPDLDRLLDVLEEHA